MKRITPFLLIAVLVVPALVITYQMSISSTTNITATATTETTTVTTTSLIPTTTTVVTTINTATNNATVTETTRLQTCVTTTLGERHIVNCNTPSTTTTATTGTDCIITGQPHGIFFRVLSDSTLKPVIGATVKATHKPASVVINNVECVHPITTRVYTTNSTEWTELDSLNDGSYSFTVEYSNHNYTLTTQMSPMSLTCTTLYIPSGRINSTITANKSICT